MPIQPEQIAQDADDGVSDDTELFYEVGQTSDALLKTLGFAHNPFTALVSPRPVGWISSTSSQGIDNLAPFSFFNAVCQNPPMVMFCPNSQHVQGGPKDSLRNVTQTGEFVVNLADWSLRGSVNASSVTAPHDVDEFSVVGLDKLASRLVRPPRVAQAQAHLECRVFKVVDLTMDPEAVERNTAVFGHVVGVHVRSKLLVNGRIDMRRADPLSRLGYLDYARIGEVESMPRPGWPLGQRQPPR